MITFVYMSQYDEYSIIRRRQVAELIGAKRDEVVLVTNTTHGLNTVLRNIEWREGDIILGGNNYYATVSKWRLTLLFL